MNRIYRLVFNRALGVLQVTSELARPARGTGDGEDGQLTAALRSVSFAVWLALGWVGVAMPGAAQQATTGRIVTDPGAPANQRPTVVAAPNGTPLVNITTPSAAGVSRNTYSQFDVGTQGAILNNSRTSTQTELGGWVQGNPWLATGTARVILNEVNSANPSHLNGYIEVAGSRAEVVIANPAGIQVNGGGFLNASRATLTTGTPVFNGGALDHYRVEGGVIGVNGAGLDASRTDYTDLITRSLQVNAGIWAQSLAVTTGANTVSAINGAIERKAAKDSAPVLAIDVGQLGGMYAGKIKLLGTEHGVGVRNAGSIGAQAGDLVVTLDGRLENTGTVQSRQNTQVSASGGVANAGVLSAARELTVSTPSDVDNSGGTLNATRVEINAQALRNRNGIIEQAGVQSLALNSGALSNRDGGRIGEAGVAPGAGTGTPGSGNAPDDPNQNDTGQDGGGGTGGGTGNGTGGDAGQPPLLPLADGALNIAGILDNDGGRIVAGGGVDLTTANGLNNDGGQLALSRLAVSQGDVSNQAGTLTVLGPASFHVGLFNNDAGTFNFNQTLTLDADWLSNRGGRLNHGGAAATRIRAANGFDNTGGALASNAETLSISAGHLVNAGGTLQQAGTQGLSIATGRLDGNAGTIATAGALTLTATDIAHRDATLSTTRLTLTADGLDNSGGQIIATGNAASALTVTGTLDNSSGTLASNGDLSLTAATFTNRQGVVQQAGTGALAIDAATLNGEGGTLVSNGALMLHGDTTNLRDGITSARRISIDTGNLTTAGGQLTATGADVLGLRVLGMLDNTGGRIGGNGAMTINAQSLRNQQGSLMAVGEASSAIVVDTVLDNSAGGRIAAGGDLELAAATLDNRSGSIEHAGDGGLSIDVATLQGQGGSISSQGMLDLTGEDIDLQGGTTRARRVAVVADTLTTADGTLASTGEDSLKLQVRTALNNNSGTIAANGALALDAGALSNREGVLTSAGTAASQVIVANGFDNTGGALTSNAETLNISAGHLVNTGGTLQQAGTQGLSIATGRLDGNAGTIATAGALTLTATDIAHRDATLSTTRLTLTANGLDNSGGQIIATGNAASALTVTGTLDNSSGTLASNGDLSLTAATFTNRQGVVQQAGTGALAIDAATLNGEGGTLVSNGALTLHGGTTNLRDGITSARRISIDTGNLITAGGQLTATGTDVLGLRVQGTLDNSGGVLASNGTVDLSAGTFANAGGTLQTAGAGQNKVQIAGGLDNRSGTLLIAGDAQVRAASLTNRGGTLQVAGASQLQLQVDGRLENDAGGVIASGGDMQLAAGEVDNRTGVVGAGGTLELVSEGGIDNLSGTVQAGETLSLSSNGLINTSGTIIGARVQVDTRGHALDNNSGALASLAGGMDIRSGALHNTAGLVQSAGDMSIDTAGHTVTNQQSGSAGGIVSTGNLDIRSGAFANQAGVVFAQGDARLDATAIDNTAAGSLSSAGRLTVHGTSLANASGTVQAGADALVALSGHLDNQAGLVAAGQALTITAATVDNRNTLSAANPALGLQANRLQLDAGSLDNRQGQVIADAASRITLAGQLDNSAGQVSSGGVLHIGADGIVNTAGTLLSGGDQTLAARTLSGDGRVLSQGDATLTLQEDFTNTGEVTANGKLALTTAGNLRNEGALQGGSLDLHAADIDNAASGRITGIGLAHLAAQHALTNRGLIDGAITHIEAGTVDNVGTGRIYGDHLAIQASELRNRAQTIGGVTRSATLAARQRLDLGVGTLTNTGSGLIYSDGDAAVGGTLDADRLAAGTANRIDNLSSTIEVSGDLDMQALAVNNVRENVVITQTTTVKAPVRLDQPQWRNNGANATNDIRTTSNYAASVVYYLHPDDILEDTPYITPDGFTVRRAVVRLTPETTAYFFGRGGMHAALGERSRMNVQDGTVTLYYFGRQDNQANPDQVASGADDPFAELSTIEPGSPAFRYVDDNLNYANTYGTCTTNCVQLWAQYDYDDPDHILINPRGTGGGGLGDNERYRIATQTVTEDVLAPGAGQEAVIHAGGTLRIGTDALLNRYGRIAAGGNLAIEGLTASASVTNIAQTLYRTHGFNNVTHAYNGTTRVWSNPAISEQTGQIGGSITSGGTLVIDVGDLSNLNQGRDAPNVQDGAGLANLNPTGPGAGAVDPGQTSIHGPAQRDGRTADSATHAGPNEVQGSTTDAVEVGHLGGTTASTTTGGTPAAVVTAAVNTTLPTSSLFTVQPNGGSYLVETDARFADYRNWLGSDYLLSQLGYAPGSLHKRLGDGYYEQKLVREQIGQLTGRRFLDGYADDEVQFQALMQAGAMVAQQYGLRPGVALSAAQVAQLTSDIVWLVEQTVTLPDGSTTTALVPQVYLRLRPGDLHENGALLAGENVNLKLSGDLVNTGDIAGRQVVAINAANIQNLAGGAIRGRAVGLQATQDINVIGATVTAADVLSVQAGGDITVASTTQTQGGGGFHQYEQTGLNRVAGLYVTHPGGLGVLSVSAGGDVTLQAAQIHNAGANGLTQIAAVGNVNLSTLTTSRSTDSTHDGKNYQRTAQTTHVGTTVQGAGNVVVQAGNDVNLTAAQLTAGNALAVQAGNDLTSHAVVDSRSLDMAQTGRKSSRAVSASDETVQGSTFSAGSDIALQAGNDLTLQAASVVSDAGGIALAAGRDVKLTAAQEEHAYEQDTYKKKSGTFSSTKTTTHEQTYDSIGVGTMLSGETVRIGAGRDIVTEGAQVAGTGDVLLAAGRNIDIGTAQNTHTEQYDVTKKKSGVFGGGGASGLGGVGFTAGSQKASSSMSLEQHTTTGSLIGSVEGNVTLVAGKDVTVTGSDVMAGRAADDVAGIGGNIAIQGQNITITSAEQTERYESHQQTKSSGMTVAMVGTPLDTVRNLQKNNQEAPTQTDKASGALNEIAAAGLTTPQLAIGYGSSKSQADTVVDTTTQRGSSLTAAGNLTLKATGNGQTGADGKPLDGDITVIGSGIAAGGIASFDAQRDINLLASTDTQSQTSSSSSKASNISLAAPSFGDLSRHVHGGANSSGVRMSPYNSGRSSSESEQTGIGQTATTVNADRVNIVSRQGDITLQGTQVEAVNGLNLLAQEGDIYLLPGQTAQVWQEANRSKQLGDLGGDGYAGTIGVRKEQHSVDGNQSSQNAIRTSLSSAQGDVNVIAKGDVLGQGVDISAGRDVALIGRNVTLDPASDTAQQVEKHQVSQYGTTLALSGYAVQAVQAAEAAGRAAEGGDARMSALYAAQGAYAAKDAAASAQGNSSGSLIKVTASVGGGSQSSQSSYLDTAQQGSTVNAGRNVTFIATGDGSLDADGYATTGDITLRGAQINASNHITLDAARDLNLLSSQSTTVQDSDHKSGSASIGVGFGLGGQQNGFTLELAAAAARGEAEGSGITHQMTQVTAGNTLTMSSGRDTTLHGAQAIGQTVLADVGRNLTLTTTQDSNTYDQQDQSAGFSASICVPPFCFGSSSFSASVSQTDIDSNYRSSTQQTGIGAGSGGFDITVGGHTQLDGAVIASTAAPELNRLSTDSLGVTHLQNVAEYSASSVSLSYSGSGSIGDQSAAGGPSASQWNGGGFSPGLAIPQSDKQTSTTRSDIAAGTVEVRNGDASALAGLNRAATELQNEGLKDKFDLTEVQRNLEAGQIGSQVVYRAAGDVAEYMQRQAVKDLIEAQSNGDAGAEAAALEKLKQWSDGGAAKTILHTLAGSLAAGVGGGDALQGALGSGAAEAGRNLPDDYGQALSLLLGAMAGGSTGAATGLAGEQFNRQLHHNEIDWINTNAEQFAEQQGISVDEGRRRLLLEGAAQVDETINRLVGTNVDEAALAFLNTAPDFGGGTYFTEFDPDKYRDFTYGLGELGHGQNFMNLFNALAASGADEDQLRYLYRRQVNDFGASQVGSSGRWVTGIVGGSALLGILPALGVEAAGACATSLAGCTQMFNTVTETLMGDALGGHSLSTVTTGTVAAAAVVDEIAEAAAKRTDDIAASANRALHEVYKDGLRGVMERPLVSDRALSSLVDDLYREGARIGSGSTAAAVRYEIATGEPVGGVWHTQKAKDYIVALQKWLDKNPAASSGDRAAAENIIRDMKNALGGR